MCLFDFCVYGNLNGIIHFDCSTCPYWVNDDQDQDYSSLDLGDEDSYD